MVFEIDNIELNFGTKKVLQAVYLKAETGKISAILGRNGQGKSCLLQLIFGSLKSKTKLFRIDGKAVLKKPYSSGNVKFLPQHNFLPNYFTSAAIFRFFKIDWKPFCLEFEAFSKYENSKISQLSAGEKRIIEIYLILKSDGELLLLDEPFSHLAPIYVEKIKTLLLQEKRRKAIVLTDHLFRDVVEISDAVYLLKDGFSQMIHSEEELRFLGYRN